MSELRSVSLDRVDKGRFRATNVRGGTLEFGEGSEGDTDFTPVELLLVALGGCTGIDVDYIAGKRAEFDSFAITVTADKLRDEQGNHLQDITISFAPRFPDGPEGDAARAMVPSAVQKSHDRLCTVGRTVQLGTPIRTELT